MRRLGVDKQALREGGLVHKDLSRAWSVQPSHVFSAAGPSGPSIGALAQLE